MKLMMFGEHEFKSQGRILKFLVDIWEAGCAFTETEYRSHRRQHRRATQHYRGLWPQTQAPESSELFSTIMPNDKRQVRNDIDSKKTLSRELFSNVQEKVMTKLFILLYFSFIFWGQQVTFEYVLWNRFWDFRKKPASVFTNIFFPLSSSAQMSILLPIPLKWDWGHRTGYQPMKCWQVWCMNAPQLKVGSHPINLTFVEDTINQKCI